MKFSVIIVNWNVRELLEKCLESLFLYVPEDTEVCVVDNASHDGSCEMIQQKFSQVNLISNKENLGFAKACNQGIRATTGEYILFLNPDTLLTATSFEPLINALNKDSNTALAAPQLLNRNGSVQKSVRRFPSSIQALAEFFRLQKPKKYAYSEITEVEQPMGAAMCARRSVLDKIGTFDEKFFVWYEEVDLCKRIRDAGHRILYIPEAEVFHVGGESFAQHPTLRKQKFFYTSYATYLWKHWKWKALAPVLLMKMYTSVLSQPYYWLPLLGITVAEAFSLVGYFFAPVQLFGFVLITLLVFLLSLRNLSYGIIALVVELVIGSKGHLLDLEIGSFTLSIRMAIFIAIMLAWLAYLLRKKERFHFLHSRFFLSYLILGASVVWGLFQAIMKQNGFSAIFADVNAWLFFFIAFPLYDAFVSRYAIQRLVIASLAALTAQFIKTSMILYVMSHKSFGVDILYPFYRWIRDTGVGEITHFEWGATRVFFQSGIYPMLALFILLPTLIFFQKSSVREYLLTQWKKIAIFSGCTAILLLGLSRSFWVAAFCIIAILFVWLIIAKRWTPFIRMVGVGSFSFAVAFVWIAAIIFFPLPSQKGGIGLDVFAKRLQDLDSEAAAASRWSLLPVLRDTIKEHPFSGYGFGKTVTYVSYDPRVLEQNKNGTFTTFSFEWGWLDFVVKMGIGGLLAYLLFLFVLIKNGIVSFQKRNDHFISGLILGIVALALVHVFTPYLNHPLGIAYILFAGLAFDLTIKASAQPDKC